MVCRDCKKRKITWDNSYGKAGYLICEHCLEERIFSAPDYATAWRELMQLGEEKIVYRTSPKMG
jgi:hypothetical protein